MDREDKPMGLVFGVLPRGVPSPTHFSIGKYKGRLIQQKEVDWLPRRSIRRQRIG